MSLTAIKLRKDFHFLLRKELPKKHVLTEVLLETLSIVAYKQPITRVEIEEIRDVNSADYAVQVLLQHKLIEVVGRKDAVGKPLLFGTTEDFLRKFGVKSIEELPEINSDKVAEFESEAEKEVQLKLDV